MAQEVVPEGVKGPFHRQALLPDCGVSYFLWIQFLADVCHRMLLIRLTLEKSKSEASVCNTNFFSKSGQYNTGSLQDRKSVV